jgi:protein-L-isoaspartate O-methyltransferase
MISTQDVATPQPISASAAEPWINAKASRRASRAAAARNASGRRRFIDPTTCDRDYTAAEIELMGAMQAYKQSSGRMFPTWSEVLEVMTGLGYAKAVAAWAE